jgi:2-methylcitrate dehydratase
VIARREHGTIAAHAEPKEVLVSGVDIKSAERPAPDDVLTAIADYALSYPIKSDTAYETAYYCLMDTLACGFQALQYPACTRLLGPIVPGARRCLVARVSK